MKTRKLKAAPKPVSRKSLPTPETVPDARARLQYFEERRGQMVETIRQLVEIESPSDNKQAVDRIGQFLAGKFSALGGKVQFHPAPNVGDHLQVDFGAQGPKAGKPVLLLGHIDTVYPLGTLATMPCTLLTAGFGDLARWI